MKNYIYLALGLLIGCNNGGGGSGSPAPASGAGVPWNAFSVQTSADLPTCSGDIIGRLYYLETPNEFQVCKSTGWTVIDVKGTNGSNGVSVSSRWGYHTDTFQSAPNITEGANIAYIGDIQLIKFSDNSCMIFVNGVIGDIDSGNTDAYYNDFSHSYFDITCTSEKSITRKIERYADSRVRYKYDLSTTPPTFKATEDVDGNFTNNTDTTYTMSQL